MRGAEAVDPLGAILRSWWVILLLVVVTAAGAGSAAAVRPARYTSSAVVVYSAADPTANLLSAGSAASPGDPDRALHTQLRVAVGDAVLSAATAKAGIEPVLLARAISVDLEPDSNVIHFRGTGDTAASAQRVTEAVVTAYVTNDRQAGLDQLTNRIDTVAALTASLNARLDGLPAGVAQDSRREAFAGQIAALSQQEEELRAAAAVYPGHVSVLSAADLPAQPSSPSPISAAGAGAGLGLLLGLLVGLLRAPRRRLPPRMVHPAPAARARHSGGEHPSPFVSTRAS